jgi:predicted kinase
MTKLVITRGLPGSGKTTYAKRWVSESEHRSRLNRDDLREVMHGGAHSYARELENAVTVAHQNAVTALLKSGQDVICDDMNLANRSVKQWMILAAEVGSEFEVVDLTNVPVEECILRDVRRASTGGRHVGYAYIEKKHQQFIKGRKYPLPLPQPSSVQAVEEYVPPQNKPKAILVDIDGTMALMNGRSPFDWDQVGSDLSNEPVVGLVSWLDYAFGWNTDTGGTSPEIIFMSGRDEVCRTETTIWLRDRGFNGHKLYMRPSLPDGVQQPGDEIVKLALFDEHIRHNYDVQFVLDDRNKVVAMWRSLGLACFQVAPGAF